MNIEISGRRYGKTFSIADYNSLLLQRDNVPLPNNLTITASGTGCALVQVNLSLMILILFSVLSLVRISAKYIQHKQSKINKARK